MRLRYSRTSKSWERDPLLYNKGDEKKVSEERLYRLTVTAIELWKLDAWQVMKLILSES